MRYAYRENHGYPGLDADRLAEEIILIREATGTLTPRALLREVRKNKKSPLRRHIFDKDIKEAAEEYYLDKARTMIRSYYIVQETRPDDRVTANVNIVGDGQSERGYYPVDEVMADQNMREECVRRMWETLLRMKRMYSHLERYAAVWKAIEETEKVVAK
jgi:hypothetical protein